MIENNREEFQDRHKEPYAADGHKTYSDSTEYPSSEDEQVDLPKNWKWRKSFLGDVYFQHRSLGCFNRLPESMNDNGYPLNFSELDPFEDFERNPPLPDPNPALLNQDGDADDEDNGDDEDGKHSKSNSKKA